MTVNKNTSHKIMERTTIISAAACAAAAIVYAVFGISLFLTLAITSGTICYHLAMRLAVGAVGSAALNGNINLGNSMFRERGFEKKLYKKLNVKSWKRKMPTYNPEDFALGTHSLKEIAETMCVSELTHWTNVILSFVPILFSGVFGAFWVFVITSSAAAVFDLCFVIMQRYNRPRIMRIMKSERAHK